MIQVKAEYAGRFISNGHGKHITRKITNWELILVVRGTLHMFVGEDQFEVPPGHFLLIPPYMIHGGTRLYPPDLSFFWVHFLPVDEEASGQLQELPLFFQVANVPRLSEYIQCLLSHRAENPEDREGLDLLTTLVLHEARRKPEDNSVLVADRPQLIQRLYRVLTIRFREPLTTSVLAKELKCNPDYLGRLWYKSFQETITETLNKIRIRRAAELLQVSTMSIGEIAYEVGFNDQTYFRRRFFQLYAMTPGNFRKLWDKGRTNTA